MDNLISRQAVIEINRSYHGRMPNEVNHRIWEEINALPSAQPETHEERTETHSCDLIDRQAAIDASRKETVSTNPDDFDAHEKFIPFMNDREISSFGKWQWANGFNTALVQMEINICQLPSAQPYTDKEIQKIQDLEQAEIQKAYDLGKLDAMEEMPKWIPCSERLPEDGENVLVTYKTTDKIHPCQYHDDGSRNPWYSYIDQCRAHMNVVLAWMPLPEPYAERREE